MFRKLSIYAIVALLGIFACGCNSEAEVTTVSTYESTNVEGFSLEKNDKLLANLDSVFFSIDLTNARIFNADSLPKGTDVRKLVVKISTTGVGGVELLVNRSEKGDTTYNYLASQTDSIDFTNPVTLRITAQNGNVRDYQVKVNVHRMEPDSLVWQRTARTQLPTALADAPAVQKAVEFQGKALVLTADASGNASMAVADNPAGEWTANLVSLPAGADVRSLAATTEALYITDADGALFTAADPFGAWTATGSRLHSLFGGYGATLLGALRNADGSWTLTSYPEGEFAPVAAPEGFPVTGNSALIVYSSKWSEKSTAVMTCGRTAAGALTSDTWAFDGSKWAKINMTGALPQKEGVTLIPYFLFKTSPTWQITEQSVLLAIGGTAGSGVAQRAVYVSRDRGITWNLAATTLRLPESMPSFAYADALVFSSPLSIDSRSGSRWTEIPDAPLPRWWRMDNASAASRAVAPVTEWECPYIYLFGGENGDGGLYDTVWRGVLNRLTFVPLY